MCGVGVIIVCCIVICGSMIWISVFVDLVSVGRMRVFLSSSGSGWCIWIWGRRNG